MTGIYCKAYLAQELRKFSGWSEFAHESTEDRGTKSEADADADDILYLHDDYVVTSGARREDRVVFQDVTDDWISFCTTQLEFAVPADVLAANEPHAERTFGSER